MVQNSKGTSRYTINNVPSLPCPAAFPEASNGASFLQRFQRHMRTCTSQYRRTELGFCLYRTEGGTTGAWFCTALMHLPVQEMVRVRAQSCFLISGRGAAYCVDVPPSL